MKTWQARLVIDSQCQLGEAPFWDARRRILHWLDIKGHIWHQYDPSTQTHMTRQLPEMITNIIPISESDNYLVTTVDALAILTSDATFVERRPIPEIDARIARFNDAACDANGRFWGGSMRRNQTEFDNYLFRLTPDAELSVQLTGIGLSNGIAWTPDHAQMLYNDTPTHQTDIFDYDLNTGTLNNRRRFATPQDDSHHPDGLTVDSEGYVWVAMWGGWRVVRYTPSGRVDSIVEVPVERVTSVTFGGEDLKTLYITTANDGLSSEKLSHQPHAGGLFAVDTSITGLPQYSVAITSLTNSD